MFDNVNMIYDNKNQIYTFKGMFGVNFKGYVTNSITGTKKTDLLFRKISFSEIVIDSFFLLELAEVCKYIINGEGPYSTWVNVKSIKKVYELIMTETWMSPNEYDFGGKFKLNMDSVDKVFKFKPMDYQEKVYTDYENFKNNLGYNGMLMDAATGVGKDQPLDCLIRIPNGWKRMGDMKLGDDVIAADGSTTKVTGVFPQGEKDVYKITFKDGRTTECGLHHLWKVYRSVRKGASSTKVMTTEDIIAFIKDKTPSEVRYYIQLINPEKNEDKEYVIPPYLMGAFIGDGCYSRLLPSPVYTISCNTVIDNIGSKIDLSTYKFRIALDKSVPNPKFTTFFISRIDNNGQPNIYAQEFIKLGLKGKRSYEKFIPEKYLNGSEEQRWELLRGLMDTDGYASKNGGMSYTTSSKQLADDFRSLVWSLGGNASIGSKSPGYYHKGEEKVGRLSYTMNIQMKEPEKVFSRPARSERVSNDNQYSKFLRLRIDKIEHIGKKETQCIMIEHPEHLYVTDNYIVTHNTFISLSLAVALETEVTIMIVMNISVDATWKRTLLDSNVYNEKYLPLESEIYTSKDYYNKIPYTNQKYIIFNYEAIEKLIPMVGSFNYKKVTLIVDEVHNFTTMDSKRKNKLVELSIASKTKDIILLSGTPIKASTLELIPYLELMDPKFTKIAQARFSKMYASPNAILKRCTPIRYGMMTTRIEKAELNLLPVEYKVLDITLKNGDDYTLKNIKEDMISYIDRRTKEIEDNIHVFKKVYTDLLFKAKLKSNLSEDSWIEYTHNFNLVCEYYVKRQLMFHSDLIKAVNDFEKVIIIPNLLPEEKKQFKEASVVLKYPMLKIRGEVLGIVVLGARIKCHKEMAEQIDYSLLDSSAAKGIVMTSYTDIAEAAIHKLQKQKYSPVGIYGDNTKISSSLINSFLDNDSINPLVGTYKSISTSLHLVVANLVILLDLPFRTYMLDQAIARVHRKGQERQVIVFYTTLNTAEEYNINSRNIDILKWAKDAVEEITGNTIKGLDFEKGKSMDEAIAGMESDIELINSGNIFEDDSVLRNIVIDISKKTDNKLLNW